MNRSTLSLAAAVAALAAVTGLATLVAPGSGTAAEAKSPARLPVERTSLLCPAPSQSDLAETTYTSFTPAGTGAGTESGKAELLDRKSVV